MCIGLLAIPRVSKVANLKSQEWDVRLSWFLASRPQESRIGTTVNEDAYVCSSMASVL